MIVVNPGKCDPNPEMAWDVGILNGLQLTWLAFEVRKMGFETTFSFQSGFWLPQNAHWLLGLDKQGEGDFSILAAVDGRPKAQIVETLKSLIQSITVTEGQWSGIQKLEGYPSDARSTMAAITCPDDKAIIETKYGPAGPSGELIRGCKAASFVTLVLCLNQLRVTLTAVVHALQMNRQIAVLKWSQTRTW